MESKAIATQVQHGVAEETGGVRRHLFGRMRVDHPGGSYAERPVTSERISRDSITLIYPGYVHTGSRCCFKTTSGEDPVAITGIARSCVHVESERHRIVLALDEPIDPMTMLPVSLAQDEEDDSTLRGEAIILDREEASWRLLQMHLRSTGLDARPCATLGNAVDEVRLHPIDLVVVVESSWESSANDTIRSLREAGWRGCTLVLVPDTRNGLAEETDRIDVAAPIDKAEIVEAARRLLQPEGRGSKPIRSEYAGDPLMRDGIQWYCQHVRERAHRLTHLRREEDLREAVSICQTLRDTADGFGFPGLRQLAESARASLLMSGCVIECRPDLWEVDRYTRRMTV